MIGSVVAVAVDTTVGIRDVEIAMTAVKTVVDTTVEISTSDHPDRRVDAQVLRCSRTCDDVLTTLAVGNSFCDVTDVQREIADLRERGWTTAAIAEAVGVRWPTIYRWVTGSRSPANAAGVVALLRQLKRRSVPPRRRERR